MNMTEKLAAFAAATNNELFDAEYNGESSCKKRLSRAKYVEKIKVFSEMLERHYGKRPIIYTTVDFHRENMVGYFGNYHLWLRSVADHPENVYARKWAFWQYTSTGVVPGIKGDTDINVFAGSTKNWNSWVAQVSK